jgi:RHS repeat-associated protein
MHSNVWTPGGRLLATYEGPGEPHPNTYHFHLTDWLGTERMQTTAAGNNEEVCYSYPFGDGLTCTGSDATEHHFTSKERDTESGLDYFGARYLSSDLGRWMTPDWASKPTAVPYATFGNPQTLNLYDYVENNPNTGIDVDGHVDPNSGQNPSADGAGNQAGKADSKAIEGESGHLDAALKGTSVTLSIGVGAAVKVTLGPVKLELEGAAKFDITGSNGKLGLSNTYEIGAVAPGGEGGKGFGLGGSVSKEFLSYDAKTNSLVPPAAGTYSLTVGGKTSGSSLEAEPGRMNFGAEIGRGATFGGNISIAKQGLQELKQAVQELRKML